MNETAVPLLVIRTDTPSLIEINRQIMGVCGENGYVAYPVSSSGDYFICAIPLEDSALKKRYPVTRRISFVKGRLDQTGIPDVSVCMWPKGVYELYIRPGEIDCSVNQAFPYTISQLEVKTAASVCRLTLYYENGIRLSLEDKGIITSAYSLGGGKDGSLSLLDVGDQQLAVVSVIDEKSQRLLILDSGFAPILDISGDAVGVLDSYPYSVTRQKTSLGHERRRAYAYHNGAFTLVRDETGFFTHEKQPPQNDVQLGIAFLEAVREGFREEAMGYLDKAQLEQLSYEDICEFIGEFSVCRPPFSDLSGEIIGVISESNGNIQTARMLCFEYSDGKICNITEL